MKIHLIRERATKEQFAEMLAMLQARIKLAVDVERGILAGGGEMHGQTFGARLFKQLPGCRNFGVEIRGQRRIQVGKAFDEINDEQRGLLAKPDAAHKPAFLIEFRVVAHNYQISANCKIKSGKISSPETVAGWCKTSTSL